MVVPIALEVFRLKDSLPVAPRRRSALALGFGQQFAVENRLTIVQVNKRICVAVEDASLVSTSPSIVISNAKEDNRRY
jgi:hypothetical protein